MLRVRAGAGTLRAGEEDLPCAVGRGGVITAPHKREGDGCTPLGSWPIRGALLRRDRISDFVVALPWRWLRRDDGWCDAPDDVAYNRAIRLPYPSSAEHLWREDDAYDAIVVLGWNDRPPLPGRGSAIFLHAVPPSGATAGCVAVSRDALLALLPRLAIGDVLEVSA